MRPLQKRKKTSQERKKDRVRIWVGGGRNIENEGGLFIFSHVSFTIRKKRTKKGGKEKFREKINIWV